MGSPINPIPNYFPPANILIISVVCSDQLYKNKSFLHQKYIVEGLSCDEIATQIFSARTTILKYLKIHGIPVREIGRNQKRVRGLAYGQKFKERTLTEHKREQEIILKIRELRDKGLSYWTIADVLNTMKVPTKIRRGKWHARTVLSILSKAKF
jgi:transposase